MKNAFTLIELLAVIVILSIILVIAVPLIVDTVEDTKGNAYASNEQMIIKGAQLFAANSIEYLPVVIGDSTEIELNDLITGDYIGDIINPYDKNDTCSGYVVVLKTDKGNEYTPYINCSVDKSNSLEDGLVAFYKLDGDATDYSLNKLDGVIHGSTITQNRLEESNSAMYFNGSSYIDLGTDPKLTPENITLMAWVKANTLTSWSGIISNMTSWGTGFSLQIGITQRIAAMISGSYLTTTWTPVTDRWYFIAATHDNTTNLNVLYVDGNSERSMTKSVIYENNAKTYIGVFYTSPNLLLNGSIDDVRIYNRVLSQEEINEIYKIDLKRHL